MAPLNKSCLSAVTENFQFRGQHNSFGWLISLIVAFLLLSSAIAHLGNPYQFLATIHSYRLLPRAMAELLAMTLPFFHIVISFCLMSRKYRRSGFIAGLLIFLIYSIAQIAVFFQGIDVDCGCFGIALEKKTIGIESIGLAAGACLLCCWQAYADSRWFKPPVLLQRAEVGS